MTIGIEYDPAGWDWWQARQAGETPPAAPDTPMTGYYRGKAREGSGLSDPPVAVWYDEKGALLCMAGDKLVAETSAMERWNFLSERHVSQADYEFRIANGRWPNEPEPVAAVAPVSDKPIDRIKARFAELTAQAKAYVRITSQEYLTQAQTARADVLKLRKRANDEFDFQAKPHKDAIEVLRGEWKGTIDSIDKLAGNLKAEMERFIADERKAAAADAARIAAMQAVGVPIGGNKPPEPIVPTPALQTQLRGARGRAASVSDKWEPIFEGWDQDAVYKHYHNNDRLIELLKVLATRDIRAGFEVPGVKREAGVKIR